MQRGLSSRLLMMKSVMLPVLLQAVLTEPSQSHYLLYHHPLLSY